MKTGLYESLLTSGLVAALEDDSELDAVTSRVDAADAPHVLARHVAEAVERHLAGVKDDEDRVKLVNSMLELLADNVDDVVEPTGQLLGLSRRPGPGVRSFTTRPSTPLSEAALLTNASGEPSLGASFERSSTVRTKSISSAHSSSGTDFGYLNPNLLRREIGPCPFA